jgi:hypothetical protein
MDGTGSYREAEQDIFFTYEESESLHTQHPI